MFTHEVRMRRVMKDIESWQAKSEVADFLSQRLRHGHVLPFIGSGVSYFADLPKWDNLLEAVALSRDPSYTRPGNFEPYTEAEVVLNKHFKSDRQAFFAAVHQELYRGKDPETLTAMIRGDAGMRALAMLCHRSVRGGSRYIFTLNYDDILELLLRDMSLVVQSVGDDRFLFGDFDVSVLHPHGLLSLADKDKNFERAIVIAQSDRNHVDKSSWKALLEVLLSKSFPIFIGIGGTDIRFLDYLDTALERNFLAAAKKYPFAGIRLCSKGDRYISTFESKKIKCVEFDNLGKDWPKFVEDVCRQAAIQAESARENHF